MAFEVKDNSGSIFANDNKTTENHPDGKGSALIGGVEYWVSSWNKVSKDGKPWRSMSFTPKEQQQAPQRPAAPAFKKPSQDGAKARQLPRENSGGFEDMDDDIPFANPMRGNRWSVM